MSRTPIPIVVFAQVPPPEHGQSRMVQRTLDALRTEPGNFGVHHVNARFSERLEDVGEGSLGKLLLTFKYLARAIRVRMRLHDPLLLYVPGPAEWAPVLRDWILLSVLRLFYRQVVFHWHAIGQGEWAHGSDRLKLDGPVWLDRCARAVSRRLLEQPFASISVSETSCKDAAAVASLHALIVPNGIEDPCPDYEVAVEAARLARQRELRVSAQPCFRILFLSHGTVEKGILDATEALHHLLATCDPQWRFDVTFAGGLSEAVEIRFERDVEQLVELGSGRITIETPGYVTGAAKKRCYLEHDIFLSPSRWESFGLTVLEAMAYGMRIVAAGSDGVSGVLPPDYPYLTPVASPEDLAAALRACCTEMLDSPDSGIGNTLRKRFLEQFQLNDFSSNLIAAFREMGEIACSGGVSPSVDDKARGQQGSAPSMRAHANEEPVFQSPAAGEPVFRSPAAGDPVFRSPAAGDPVFRSPAARCFGESVREESKTEIEDRGSEIEAKPSASHSPRAPMATSGRAGPSRPTASSSLPSPISNLQSPISLSVYLADQNPGYDRSFGISRMTRMMLEALLQGGQVKLETISSKTSQQAPAGIHETHVLPWGTRRKWLRLLTDHFHPLFHNGDEAPDVYYFPKGYLPWWHHTCEPSVVTIHDTIIQYDADQYPKWRKRWEYNYWTWLLKHTLRHAARIMTVSESSKKQILDFMGRHGIPHKEIAVTYEPCMYEQLAQPVNPAKENYVIHLASLEPHKRSAHLIRWWHEAEQGGRHMPSLHLVGTVPDEVKPLLASSRSMVRRPFLDDELLQEAYRGAHALILPSEIEGFGLPALEAYYLGTPVCYVKGTSVEEILSPATSKGGFTLDDPASLFAAMDEVVAMGPEEVRECGLKLRATYASEKVAERMLEVFRNVKNEGSVGILPA